MAKYMLAVNYVGDGIQGLIKDGGTKRRAVAAKAVESVGGRLESFYYAFGEADAYLIAEVPDNVTMAALAITINASDVVAVRTTVLLTCEEIDAAVKTTAKYKPPKA